MLPLEYLQGTWCFARGEGEGGGESGIIIFYADGTYRIAIGGTPTEHYLGELYDLETFWERMDLAEVEPDRFVVLYSPGYSVVHVRAPC